MGSGATFSEVSKTAVEAFEIPLPPLEEQRRIAAILNEQMAAVKRARAAAEAQFEAAKALPAAYLRAVFSSPEAQKWPIKTLGEVTRVASGSTPRSGTEGYWDGDIVWITPTDLGKLSSKEILTSDRRITKAGYESCGTELVPPGSVVMSSRAPIGHLMMFA
jgi:type I restriction enzyme S subunit